MKFSTSAGGVVSDVELLPLSLLQHAINNAKPKSSQTGGGKSGEKFVSRKGCMEFDRNFPIEAANIARTATSMAEIIVFIRHFPDGALDWACGATQVSLPRIRTEIFALVGPSSRIPKGWKLGRVVCSFPLSAAWRTGRQTCLEIAFGFTFTFGTGHTGTGCISRRIRLKMAANRSGVIVTSAIWKQV